MVNEIITIGRINIDMVMYVDTLPGRIQHVISDKGHISFGGSAANFAVEATLLGVKTGLVSCVGDDIYGEMVLKQLSKFGVDTSNVLVLGKQATGLFFMARHPTDGNIVVATPGANRFLEKHVLDEEYVARASSVHVAGGFPMMTSRALEIASTNGMIFSFDPGHAADNVDFSKILPGTDLLFVNQYELKKYFDVNLSEKALKAFAKGFPGMVIVKTGSKGAIATDGFEYHTSDIFEVPVVDTVGAGDAFAAGFLIAWTRSEKIAQALHFANAVAALEITKSGAQTGPTLDETANLLAKHGVSIEPILRSFGKGKGKRRYRRN